MPGLLPVRILLAAALMCTLVACQSMAPRTAGNDQPTDGTGREAPSQAAQRGDPEHTSSRGLVAKKKSSRKAPGKRSRTPRGKTKPEAPAPPAIATGPMGPEPDLWQRLRSDFEFVQCEPAHTMRASLRGFTAHPRAFERLFVDAAPHIAFVATRLREAGVPAEFALLPMVESRYLHRPRQAGSRGPAGPWQLMPHTARAMGLTVDRSRDERMDLAPSTNAAIRLLKSLHDQFGDWTLVNLAYNAGDGRVRGALRRAGGWQGDPYALSLSPITRAHFSRLRALVCICASPERYGLNLPPQPGQPWAPVRAVAVSTGSGKTAKADADTGTYVVARGDSLWDLARRYGVKLQDLRRWNALDARALLRPGQVLRLRAP